MNQKQVNDALDKALDGDFADNFVASVPIVLPQKVEVPATCEAEQQQVKSNLYNTNEKLNAVLDYLINNLEDLSNQPGLVKTSPVSDIVEVAKTIGMINDKIYKYITPQKTEIPKNSKITQNNITFNNNGNKEEEVDSHFTLETLDKMIKDGKLK
jgi:predicted DNA-binding transcriptional regulator AlpA